MWITVKDLNKKTFILFLNELVMQILSYNKSQKTTLLLVNCFINRGL